MKQELTCSVCNMKTNHLVPKKSNKKGYEGWNLVCRVCYDWLDDIPKQTELNSKKETSYIGVKKC